MKGHFKDFPPFSKLHASHITPPVRTTGGRVTVSGVMSTSTNTKPILFLSGFNERETSATSQVGREGRVKVCRLGRPKVGLSWCEVGEGGVQKVLGFTFIWKAGFAFKAETELGRRKKKDGWK